jgi:hypothetical protein
MDAAIYDSGYYRKQAHAARMSAANVLSDELRRDYLKLAMDWDRLARDVDAQRIGATRTTI